MIKYKCFLYVDKKSDGLLRIHARKRPSRDTQPRSGTWVVGEFNNGEWGMPCFPEILIETIEKQLIYLGELKS